MKTKEEEKAPERKCYCLAYQKHKYEQQLADSRGFSGNSFDFMYSI